MIGWMIFYILAIPAFSFFLPLYSFWRMDDFSWGQTRVVLGESGKKVIVHVCVALVRCSDIMTNLTFRTKENSILALYPSSLGMIMSVIVYISFYGNLTYLFRRTNSGTKNLIIVLDHGYLRRRPKTKDMRNHGLHPCTAARLTMNQEASHRRLLNSECTPLLDTNPVAIPLNLFSIQW